MSHNIRTASAEDAPAWVKMARKSLGEDHPAKQVFDLGWAVGELGNESAHETWVAESDGQIVASISFLDFAPRSLDDSLSFRMPKGMKYQENPVANLGRNILLPESYDDGAAQELIKKIASLCDNRRQQAIVRVLASDNRQQILFEQEGFVCVGFQPDKHHHRTREEVLFYVRPARSIIGTRVALSESLPQINELASVALANLHISGTMSVRDGGTGYPLQTDVDFIGHSDDKYLARREEVEKLHPHQEISGGHNTGHGFMRVPGKMPTNAIVACRQDEIVGGVRYLFDEMDRCVRVLDAFCTDNLSLGALFHELIKVSHAELNASYVEVDILLTSVRLLISAEQLGFVPVAYFPGFYKSADGNLDVVKMVKFNQNIAIDAIDLTAHAQSLLNVVNNCLKDQAMGTAIVNMLRDLTIFKGLGDGELRKLARLFTQKLFKPGEVIFKRDDAGNEAFVVMRGQVDIVLSENTKPIAKMEQGQIFGELAFLDGSVRGAMAVARQPTILLIINRLQFFELTQREPNLGYSVMKNLALELGARIRRMNTAFESSGN